MPNQKGHCVIFLHTYSHKLETSQVSNAQAYALKTKLPLSVITCVDEVGAAERIKVLKELIPIEKELAKNKIPLIVLMGNAVHVLPGFIHHVMPRKIYTDHENNDYPLKLTLHPYPWPGTVIPVKGVIQLIETDRLTC